MSHKRLTEAAQLADQLQRENEAAALGAVLGAVERLVDAEIAAAQRTLAHDSGTVRARAQHVHPEQPWRYVASPELCRLVDAWNGLRATLGRRP